ncbi:PREDICTED: coiled-coil domain-containing protein 27 [Calidris pugnax]|uniref:coiled-coil domain-containing protein 27 n=1 Tax=Calidris pugnax TaxID=198806 RepID=UPI00071DF3BB|nr:PREDICTED: coiled-coil domain-containing protein 27 [Calidris pugnax]
MEGASPDAAAPGVPQEAGVGEGQSAGPDLREELQKAKHDYSMATGTISSLQRQLEFQESQLRRIKSEKEMLQKKLREQENQLQAMATKICNLRDEWKHDEMMMATEEENGRLRQVVREQESKLAEQNQLLSELQETISQLRAEALSSRRRIREQQQAQEEIQSQVQTLQHRELQTRVTLERITSRFERYRSKIIQATFSVAGSKPPQAEVTDEEVLEAMQKIINEWTELHQLLKQKGIKVPSLHSIDTLTSSPASTKGRRKSPMSTQ